jgi:hypothetical protein
MPGSYMRLGEERSGLGWDLFCLLFVNVVSSCLVCRYDQLSLGNEILSLTELPEQSSRPRNLQEREKPPFVIIIRIQTQLFLYRVVPSSPSQVTEPR